MVLVMHLEVVTVMPMEGMVMKRWRCMILVLVLVDDWRGIGDVEGGGDDLRL